LKKIQKPDHSLRLAKRLLLFEAEWNTEAILMHQSQFSGGLSKDSLLLQLFCNGDDEECVLMMMYVFIQGWWWCCCCCVLMVL
jgi:hypothetical protein